MSKHLTLLILSSASILTCFVIINIDDAQKKLELEISRKVGGS